MMALVVLITGGCDMKQKNRSVAWVDVAAVISMSVLGEQEQQRLEEVVGALKKAQNEAEALYGKMDKDKAAEARRSDQQVLQSLLTDASHAARNSVIAQVRHAVEQVREQENIQIVVEKNQVLAADESSNITAKVTEALKDAQTDFGSLPSLTVSAPKTEAKKVVKEDISATPQKK